MAAGAGAAGLKPVQFYLEDDDASDDDEFDFPRRRKRRNGNKGPYEYHAPLPPENIRLPGLGHCDDDDDAPRSPPSPCYSSSPADLHAAAKRQSTSFAEGALRRYNADPSSTVKYELVEAGLSNGMLTLRGFYGHVNFVARPRGGESLLPERFFFAEVRQSGSTWIPTCLRSLDSEDDRVGGVRGKGKPWNYGVDHCLSCSDAMKHPKDGSCYKVGHYTPHPLPSI